MSDYDKTLLDDLERSVRSAIYSVEDAWNATIDLGYDYAMEKSELRSVLDALNDILDRL